MVCRQPAESIWKYLPGPLAAQILQQAFEDSGWMLRQYLNQSLVCRCARGACRRTNFSSAATACSLLLRGCKAAPEHCIAGRLVRQPTHRAGCRALP